MKNGISKEHICTSQYKNYSKTTNTRVDKSGGLQGKGTNTYGHLHMTILDLDSFILRCMKMLF